MRGGLESQISGWRSADGFRLTIKMNDHGSDCGGARV
jgi:hypothetical protein